MLMRALQPSIKRLGLSADEVQPALAALPVFRFEDFDEALAAPNRFLGKLLTVTSSIEAKKLAIAMLSTKLQPLLEPFALSWAEVAGCPGAARCQAGAQSTGGIPSDGFYTGALRASNASCCCCSEEAVAGGGARPGRE